jgi:hypothetical protein
MAGNVDPRHWVLYAAHVLFATGAGPARVLSRHLVVQEAEDAPHEALDQAAVSVHVLVRRDVYLRRILALLLVSTVALTLADYLFKAASARTVSRGSFLPSSPRRMSR